MMIRNRREPVPRLTSQATIDKQERRVARLLQCAHHPKPDIGQYTRESQLEELRRAINDRYATAQSNAAYYAYQAAKQALRDANPNSVALTCQICGRLHLPTLGEGMIAHHGYERPGLGWQTASCEGAWQLPFEVGCDALQRHLKAIDRNIKQAERRAADLRAALAGDTDKRAALAFRRSHDRVVSAAPNSWSKPTIETIHFTVTEMTLAQCQRDPRLAGSPALFKRATVPLIFAEVINAALHGVEEEIRGLTAYLLRQQRRLAMHRVTHERINDHWAPIAPPADA